MTYGGTIIMDLGNYDVVLRTGDQVPLTAVPRLLGHDAGPFKSDDPFRQPLPQIIYKGNSGMRWDGRSYFYHPSVRYDLVAPYVYGNRIVGRDEEVYPPTHPQATTTPETTEYYPPTGRYAYSDRPTTRELEGETYGDGDARRTPVINPFPLPDMSPDALSELCEAYPYAIQSSPLYRELTELARRQIPKSQGIPQLPPGEDVDLRGDRTQSDHSQPGRDPRRQPQPQVAQPRLEQLPIVITNPKTASDAVTYTLRSVSGEASVTLLPGQTQQFWPEGDWSIGFDSHGIGTKAYRLRGGQRYRFTKNQSGAWELHRRAIPASDPILFSPVVPFHPTASIE
jgi:hypothetical protein